MLTSLHIIESVTVPVNMTCFFQPLDSTVNEAAKHFMKKQFAFDISNAVKHQLDTGKRDEDIDVDMRIRNCYKTIAYPMASKQVQLLQYCTKKM